MLPDKTEESSQKAIWQLHVLETGKKDLIILYLSHSALQSLESISAVIRDIFFISLGIS